METERFKLLAERVNLRLVLWVVVVAVVGGAALLLSGLQNAWKGNEHWQSLLRTVGSSLIVTGGLTMIWNFVAKRAFLDEVLAKAGIAKELQFAGVLQITGAFYRDVDWARLFKTVKKLDLFFAYAQTWRHIHTEELQRLSKVRGARIRIVLPDPEAHDVVSELARRFRSTPEDIIARIRDAEKHLNDLQSLPDRAADITIWFLPAAPQFSFYRFDRVAVISLYSHRPDRNPVPAFVVESGGSLYDYVRAEFDAMVRENGLARLAPLATPARHLQ